MYITVHGKMVDIFRQSTERHSVCSYSQQKVGGMFDSQQKMVGMFPQSTERWRFVPTVIRKMVGMFLQSTERRSVCFYKMLVVCSTVNRKMVGIFLSQERYSICPHSQQKGGLCVSKSTERWSVCFFSQQKDGRHVPTVSVL